MVKILSINSGESKLPTYSYQCKDCGDHFDQFQTMSNYLVPTETPCTKCSGEIQKIITSPMIVDPTRLGLIRTDSDFRNVLENIGRKVYKSNFSIT